MGAYEEDVAQVAVEALVEPADLGRNDTALGTVGDEERLARGGVGFALVKRNLSVSVYSSFWRTSDEWENGKEGLFQSKGIAVSKRRQSDCTHRIADAFNPLWVLQMEVLEARPSLQCDARAIVLAGRCLAAVCRGLVRLRHDVEVIVLL